MLKSDSSRKIKKIVKNLESEAIYLNKLNTLDPRIKAEQIGMSEGMIMAANILRNQFGLDENYLIEEEMMNYAKC
jgi:hypothetical protein